MSTHLDPSDTERELREALATRARQIQPSDRLDAILHEASAVETSRSRGPWLAAAGVAAAAAVVAGVVWAAQPDTDSTLPGGTSTPAPTSPGVTEPAPSPTTGVSTPPPSTSPSQNNPSGTPGETGNSAVAQAIYRVGSNGGASDRPGLVREYRSVTIPASEDARVKSAVIEALTRTDLWRGTSLVDWDVTRDSITLRLSGPGAAAPTVEAARLAAYALVWTAQGAVGRGDVPVSIVPAAGDTLLGQLDSSKPFTRAATPPDALADIWIDTPSPGAALSAGRAITVRGQAVAWEANVEWELRRGSDVVDNGFTTASIGAPSRGTYSVDLGPVAAGTYTFRAFTTSMADSSVMSERLVTFTVR
ncbi:Gmad2 immunoglobulin-like domain-containing protein [Knoellia subterranea]|uniref:Bacterial spore germination immunoglobulin-like domain-containing protein n=1 Tax=Knoellia subterranea KCTC 19937 TaxID=1385521 RepID=A0A0A0JU22_9MICO|nr:Gmad2 immunoglobulin-like domain-containing protein [Knoellia subterranea]KGN39552.1 hypothetical protein N803_00645 [Knoellia subterranea KCTC 19937]